MIVLDTHVWLWWLSEQPEELSATALRAIEDAQQLGISTLSCYEVVRAERRQRVILETDVRNWLSRAVSDERISMLPPTVEIATLAADLDWVHGDPFDRIIVATALAHGAPLITKDDRIRRSAPVRTIW